MVIVCRFPLGLGAPGLEAVVVSYPLLSLQHVWPSQG